MKKFWLLGLLVAASPVVADGQRVDMFTFDLPDGEKLTHMVTQTEDPKRSWHSLYWVDKQGRSECFHNHRTDKTSSDGGIRNDPKIMAAATEKNQLRVVIDWQNRPFSGSGIVPITPQPADGKDLDVRNVIRHDGGGCQTQGFWVTLKFLGYLQTLEIARQRYGPSSEGRFILAPSVAVLSHALGELKEIRFQTFNTIQCLWKDGNMDTVTLNADGEVVKVVNAPELVPEHDD